MRQGLMARAVQHAQSVRDARRLNSEDPAVRDHARRHLAERMGRLKGLPQKLGQVLGTSAGPTSATWKHLGDSGDPLPIRVIRKALRKAWGRPVEEVVAEMDSAGFAASLGQVHRARLQTGEVVAIKVAYPGIARAVRNDLRLLGWASRARKPRDGVFDLASYKDEIVRDLEEELDYAHERSAQEAYRDAVSDEPNVIVPETFPELCTDNVLVTGWEDGDDLATVATWPLAQRVTAARAFLRHFVNALFDRGFIHGALHPGNFRFRRQPSGEVRIVLYDFGSTMRLDEQQRLLLLRLVDGTMRRRGDPFSVLVGLGFSEDLLIPIREQLPALCSTVFEPFATMGPSDMRDWHRRRRVDDILGEYRWNLRMAGPASLILVMRAFHGLIHVMETLDAPVAWQVPLLPLIAANEGALRSLEDDECDPDTGFDTLADRLRIRVTDGDQEKVALALPASSVERLETLIDDDLATKIHERDISVEEIVRTARQSGYAPGELFRLTDDESGREVHMWLE